jgi:hypothetical protein
MQSSHIESGWDAYRRALRPTDQAVFDRLLELCVLAYRSQHGPQAIVHRDAHSDLDVT